MTVPTRRLAGSVACIVVAVAATIAAAQPQAAPPPLSVQPQAVPPQQARSMTPSALDAATPAIESAPMPIQRIERPTLLDEQIAAMRDAMAEFNSVIVRDPGVPSDYPMVPAMALKNVTVGQFLRFLQESLPGVTVHRIDGPNGPLYSIRVRLDEGAMGFDPPAKAVDRLRLYRLTEVINALADAPPADARTPEMPEAEGAMPTTRPSREARVKQATDHVLSLLQAALAETEPDQPHVVKIHEPTLTLLFKGSTLQQAVLEDALLTLHPQGRLSLTRNSLRTEYNPILGEWTVPTREAGRQTQVPRHSGRELLMQAYEADMQRQLKLRAEELVKAEQDVAAMRKELTEQMVRAKTLQDQLERRAAPDQPSTGPSTKPAKY